MLPRIALTLFTVMFADLIGNKHFKEVDVDVRMAAKSGTQLINIVISCGDAITCTTEISVKALLYEKKISNVGFLKLLAICSKIVM